MVRSLGDLAALRSMLYAQLDSRGFSSGDTAAVVLACHEAAKNGLRFSRGRPVHIAAHFQSGWVVVCIADEGEGFELTTRRTSVPAGGQETSGRGVFLMRQSMDWLEVAAQPFGCVVRMGKRLANASP